MTEPLCHCGRPSPDAFLCQSCAKELEQIFAELPALLIELDFTATRQSKTSRRGDEKRTKASEEQLPYNIDASNLLSSIRTALVGNVQHLCESRGLEVPALDSSPAMAIWLCAYIESIRQDEAAASIHTSMVEWNRAIIRCIDNPPERMYAGPCNSGAVATFYVDEVVTMGPCAAHLYRNWGAETITCDGWRQKDTDGCGTEYTLEEREAWLLAAIEDELAPLELLVDVLERTFHFKLDRDLLKKWRKRERLMARSLSRQGVELYRGGDLLVLIRDEQPRPGRKRSHGFDGRMSA